MTTADSDTRKAAPSFATDPESPTRLNASTQRLLDDSSRHAHRGGWLSSHTYNLTISHEYRFLWFRVAKVGTRTILEHLRKSGVPLDVEHAMAIPYPRSLFRDYFKFAFVRHPAERLLSCWRNKVLDENYFHLPDALHSQCADFEQFLSWVEAQDLDRGDHHLRRQTRLVDLNHLDFLGRMESFEADFDRICETIGIPCGPIPHINTSRSTGDDAALNASLRQRIHRLYEIDFQVFGYSPAIAHSD